MVHLVSDGAVLFAGHSVRLCLFIPLSTFPNHCKTFQPPATSKEMDSFSGIAALAALDTARPMVRVAHDADDFHFHHYFDCGPLMDMLRQEMSKSSTLECSMPARGLGSTTKPYDCQDPGPGQGSEESDQQLNTTPFWRTIEKCKRRLPRACHLH